MSDIFLSYAKEDRDWVAKLAAALAATGKSVFWDRTLPAGITWRSYIGKELKSARCIVVVWSDSSVKSDWVLEEAEIGRNLGVLIPVLRSTVETPLGFGSIQAADLSGWDGNRASSAFKQLTHDMERLLGSISDQEEEVQKLETEILKPSLAAKPGTENLDKREGVTSKSWVQRFVTGTLWAVTACVAVIILVFSLLYFEIFQKEESFPTGPSSLETNRIDVDKLPPDQQTPATRAIEKIQILTSRPEARYGIPDADQYLLNDTYISGYSYRHRQPKWTLELLEPDKLRDEVQVVERVDSFREDLRIPEKFRATPKDYAGSGYDRGHLVSSGNWRQRALANSHVFLMSNISPQHPRFNRDIWNKLESAVRNLAKDGKYLAVYVISGPLFSVGNRPTEVIGKNQISVPHRFFKSVLAEDRKGRLRLWNFSIPNEKDVSGALSDYLVPTTEIEHQTGFLLWDQLQGSSGDELRQSIRPMW